MKSFILAVLVLLTNVPAYGKEYVVALSPWQEEQAASRQADTILQFIANLQGGDTVTLVDGYNLTSLGRFDIPDKPGYDSPRARINANRPAAANLARFYAGVAMPSGNRGPRVEGAVKLPQLLRHIANTRSSSGPLEVIVLASPVYDDPADAAFSMAGGAVIPSDAHLLASRSATPFGTSTQEQLLSGVRVHIAYPAETMRHGDQYAFLLERFWTLFMERQSGKLVTISADLAAVVSRALSGLEAPALNFEMGESGKLEMLILRAAPPRQSIYERVLAQSALSPAELARASVVEVGLSWDCPRCDLDLYARPYPDADILYFGNTQTPEGRYWKDFRTSPQEVRGYETIEFRVPLDLRNLEIVVNHFSGDSGESGITGELRIAVNGHTYALGFHLASRSGDRGAGVRKAFATGADADENTRVISPLTVLAAE